MTILKIGRHESAFLTFDNFTVLFKGLFWMFGTIQVDN